MPGDAHEPQRPPAVSPPPPLPPLSPPAAPAAAPPPAPPAMAADVARARGPPIPAPRGRAATLHRVLRPADDAPGRLRSPTRSPVSGSGDESSGTPPTDPDRKRPARAVARQRNMSVSSEDDDQAAESGHNDDGDKPYVCTTCNYTFTRKHDRDRHVRRHEGSNPYTCPDCGEGFYRSDTLARHQRSDRGRLSCQLRRQMNGLQPGQAAVPSRNSLPSGSPRQQHIPPTQRSPGQPAPLTPASWEQHPEVPYMDVQRYPSAPEYRPAPPLSAASDAPRVPYPSSGYWAGGYYVAMDDPMWRSGYEYGLSRARDSFSQASPPAHSPPQQAASTQGYHQRQPSSHQIAQSPQAQHAPQLPAVQRNVSSGTFRTDVGSYPTPDSIGEWRPPSERPGQSWYDQTSSYRPPYDLSRQYDPARFPFPNPEPSTTYPPQYYSGGYYPAPPPPPASADPENGNRLPPVRDLMERSTQG